MKSKKFYFDEIKTNIGNLFILENSEGICLITFAKDQIIEKIKLELSPKKGLYYFKKIKPNLKCYINQKEKLSKFPINFIWGTSFQIGVWKQILKIPHGSLSNYSKIAKNINNLKAVRAVGNAIAKNPILIYVPCHRVVTKSGNLGGYRWGMPTKRKLLHIEGINKK